MKRARSKCPFNGVLHIIGLLACIVPPAVCTLLYFPLWRSVGASSVIAGGVALILVLCAMPLFKFFREKLRSPASYVMWFLAFLLFFFVSKVAEEMTVICFVGFVSNLAGAVLFGLAKRGKTDE